MSRTPFVAALLVLALCTGAVPLAHADHGTAASFVAPSCGNETLTATGARLDARTWAFKVSGRAVNGGSCIGFQASCIASGSPESGWTSASCEPACANVCLTSFSLTGTGDSRPPFGPSNRAPIDQAAATLTLSFSSGFASTHYVGILTVVA